MEPQAPTPRNEIVVSGEATTSDPWMAKDCHYGGRMFWWQSLSYLLLLLTSPSLQFRANTATETLQTSPSSQFRAKEAVGNHITRAHLDTFGPKQQGRQKEEQPIVTVSGKTEMQMHRISHHKAHPHSSPRGCAQMYHIEVIMPPWFGIGRSLSNSAGAPDELPPDFP